VTTHNLDEELRYDDLSLLDFGIYDARDLAQNLASESLHSATIGFEG